MTVFVVCVAVLTGGCSTMGSGVRASASGALRDPWTWAPIAGAGLVAITQSDRRLSDWAREQTPIFGSTREAVDAGHRLGEGANTASWLVYAFADERGDGPWVTEKAIDAGANVLGVAAAREVTLVAKRLTKRERPGIAGNDSFPSARASDAFAHAGFGRYYAERLPIALREKKAAQWTVSTLAATASWARIEAGGHFPTDVLVGAALGNFSAQFFTEWLAPNAANGWRIAARSESGSGLVVTFSRSF